MAPPTARTKIRYKVRQSTAHGIALWFYAGRKRIGHILGYWKHWSKSDWPCSPEMFSLVEKYPALGNPKALLVGTSHLDPDSHGQGIGLTMYEALMAEGFKENGPHLFVPEECSMGSGTSRAAQRVWQSLTRRFPSEGSVVAVLGAPPIRTAALYDEGWVGDYWGRAGAGVLFTTGERILLLKRASWVDEPGTWGVPGGAIPVDENGEPIDAMKAAMMEVNEEIGRPPSFRVIDKFVFRDGRFAFTTFIAQVDEEFTPRLNAESTDHEWVDRAGADRLTLHPGVKTMLGSKDPWKGGKTAGEPTLEVVQAPGLAYTIKARDESGFLLGGLYTEVPETLSAECEQDVQALSKRLGRPLTPLFVGWVRANTPGQGLGLRMYEAALREAAKRQVVLLPAYCAGKTVAPAARRIWEKLKQRHPSEGSAVAVRVGSLRGGKTAAPVTWGDVEDEIKAFKPIADMVLAWRSPVQEAEFEANREAVRRIAFAQPGRDDGDPTKFGTAFHKWLSWNVPGQSGETRLQDLRTAMRKPALDALDQYGSADIDVASLIAATQAYVTGINDMLDKAGPGLFTYSGFRVENPLRLHKKLLPLDAIDFMLAMFKRRGVEPLLREGVQALRVKPSDLMEGAGGYYYSRTKTIEVAPSGVYVYKTFIHEFGHHVHMSYLAPQAKAEWDAGWVHVDEAKKRVEDQIVVTSRDRHRFFRLIEQAGWNPQRAGRKVKGLDRLKFLAWLYKTDVPLLSTPKQVRLTDHGREVFRFFADPDSFRREFHEYNSPETAERMLVNRERLYRGRLGLTPQHDGKHHPMLDEKTVERIRSEDTGVDQALDALGIPSTYGKTNVLEDFAETFVPYLTAPSRLSDTARYRMDRAFWLSGYHGKPVMRVAAGRVAARWLQASNFTMPYLEKLVGVVVSDPTGWGEGSPAARVLRQMIKSIGFGNLDPFPVDELWTYLSDRDVDADEIALMKQVRKPRARKKKVGPTFYEAWRAFERVTGKSTILQNIDLDNDHHLAPALLAITKAAAKLPARSARLWQSEVKKVMLVGRSKGTQDGSWRPGGVMRLVLGKRGIHVTSQSVPTWRVAIVHELGHALGDKLNLVLGPGDDTPYGQPPYVSAYAEKNAEEDFAETFLALEMEPSHLKRVAPAKYLDMRGRV